MPLLVLKIDVDTCRGTREGVPALLRMLQRHDANATFLFSLGPDHTGWALKRAFRPGFLSKVARTSVLEHYGLRQLLYGVLLPAPDIGVVGAAQMRAIRQAGYECGMHCWDHVLWQDNVRQRSEDWTAVQMRRAIDRFESIFGSAPATHGAAGWQMNSHAFRLLDTFGMHYASDGRACLRDDGSLVSPASGPHRLSIDGQLLSCLQLPTTLPTMDELLGRVVGGRMVDAFNIAETLLRLTAEPRDHVFTLHAELEGNKLAIEFEKLLAGWRAQGYTFASMANYYHRLKDDAHPIRSFCWRELPGRSGELIAETI